VLHGLFLWKKWSARGAAAVIDSNHAFSGGERRARWIRFQRASLWDASTWQVAGLLGLMLYIYVWNTGLMCRRLATFRYGIWASCAADLPNKGNKYSIRYNLSPLTFDHNIWAFILSRKLCIRRFVLFVTYFIIQYILTITWRSAYLQLFLIRQMVECYDQMSTVTSNLERKRYHL
jgi:hypothetical protein